MLIHTLGRVDDNAKSAQEYLIGLLKSEKAFFDAEGAGWVNELRTRSAKIYAFLVKNEVFDPPPLQSREMYDFCMALAQADADGLTNFIDFHKEWKQEYSKDEWNDALEFVLKIMQESPRAAYHLTALLEARSDFLNKDEIHDRIRISFPAAYANLERIDVFSDRNRVNLNDLTDEEG